MKKRGRYSPDDLISSDNLPTTRGENIQLPSLLSVSGERDRWETALKNPLVPKVVDLFCGAGGMSAGFVSAGFAVAAAFDRDKFACRTFAANIPTQVSCVNISDIVDPGTILANLTVSGIDVVIGGPPCQGFSQVGRARIQSLKADEQTRLLAQNELYTQFFRFVEAFQPSFFVMENVPNLATFENGAYMTAIEKECERLGYELERETLNAVDHHVPQGRRRLFLVGSRVGKLFRWPRPIHEQDRIALEAAIGDLPSVTPPSLVECLPYHPKRPLSLYQQLMRSRVKAEDKDVIYDHLVRPVRDDDLVIFSNMTPGQKYDDIDPKYRRYNSKSFKDKYYMLRPDAPSVTITAHLHKDGYRYIHYDVSQHRTISVREAARIQSFGDHFRFCGFRSSRFKQIGNAVPPLLAQAIAEQVLKAIRRSSGPLPGDLFQHALPGIQIDRLVDAES